MTGHAHTKDVSASRSRSHDRSFDTTAAAADVRERHALPFPDDEHAWRPARRALLVRVATSALPPAPSRAFGAAASLPKTHKQLHRRRIANPSDSVLWGFSVYYSPVQEVQTQWQRLRENEAEQQTACTHNSDDDSESSGPASVTMTATSSDNDTNARADRAQYLLLASRYGPLTALLYCCSPQPGRVYTFVTDRRARQLQRWTRQRMRALRRYWIERFAYELATQSLAHGVQSAVQSRQQQQRATVLLRRLQWRCAAAALRGWFGHTQRQHEVRWRFQFALGEDVRARFGHWRTRIVAAKRFRQHLKSVTRGRRLAAVLARWSAWCAQQKDIRQLLARRWTQTQRRCLTHWHTQTTIAKLIRRAAVAVQRMWRGYRQRARLKQQRQSATLLERVARGCAARQRAHELRADMAAAATLLRVVHVVAWRARCETLQLARERLVAHEAARLAQEQAAAASAAAVATEGVRAELAKVVRNAMHRRLQETLTVLRESGEAEMLRAGSVRRRSHAELVEVATAKLVAEAQHDARAFAVTQFRAQRREHRALEGCVVCCAEASVAALAQRNSSSSSDDDDKRGSVHACSRFSFSGVADLQAIGCSLAALCAQEAAWERDVLWCETTAIPELWHALWRARVHRRDAGCVCVERRNS